MKEPHLPRAEALQRVGGAQPERVGHLQVVHVPHGAFGRPRREEAPAVAPEWAARRRAAPTASAAATATEIEMESFAPRGWRGDTRRVQGPPATPVEQELKNGYT
jgi:hypothetical protein